MDIIEEHKIELYNLLKRYLGYNTQDQEDLVHSVYEIFLKRKYIEKFDPVKSSFKTFVNRYYKFIIGNINTKNKYLNTVALMEGFNDKDNNLLADEVIIKKETLSEVFDYFTDEELDIMSGELRCTDLARAKGVTRQAVNEKLRNRIKSFKKGR